jgi:LCP family protein required for cell wall assembly
MSHSRLHRARHQDAVGRRSLPLLRCFSSCLQLVLQLVSARAWGEVERVDLASTLHGARSGTNYLIVGTDSRSGLANDVENANLIFGPEVAGERTDTIAILRIDGDTVSLLAIPRDLYIPLGGGALNRMNAAFASGGPTGLIDTVQRELEIGIDHYLEINLAGFLGLVDALGGVTIDFPHPAFDERSGLLIDTAGPTHLDGAAALAYVRSRRYTELVDGVALTDPTSDLGRVERQQRFLAAIMAKLSGERNPFVLLDIVRAVASNVTVDNELDVHDAAALGLRLRGAQPRTATIPTSRYITPGGADVLVLTAESERVLADFRG